MGQVHSVGSSSQVCPISEVGVYDLNPLAWELAHTRARESVGKLRNKDGQPLGCGILIGVDRLLVPYHVIEGDCPENLSAFFTKNDSTTCCTRLCPVLRFLVVDDQLDFAILQLSKGDCNFYPGEDFNIPDISHQDNPGAFVLGRFDQDEPVSEYISGGEPCYDGEFCSFANTDHGCSGSGYFDREGNLFAMHLSRSSGLCGDDSQQRRAISLSKIIRAIPEVFRIQKSLPSPEVESIPACAITSLPSDHCVILERHGTLQSLISSSETIYPITKSLFSSIVSILHSKFNDIQAKKAFFDNIWGSLGTVYRHSNFRIDRQSHTPTAANLQIQVKGITLATALVANDLLSYAQNNPARIAEVVNYVVRKFEEAIHFAYHSEAALVYEISLRNFH